MPGDHAARPTRRALLAAAAASSAVVVGCGGEDDDTRQREREAADLEIVRYLLALEDVESAFWSQAEERVKVAPQAADVVIAVARNEREHVAVLERWARRLGGDRPRAPDTDFDEIFAAGPAEVLGSGASLENLSAAAYLGQINRIQDRNLLASLLAIHTVEGRQAAALNHLAGRPFAGTGPLEGSLPDGAFAEPMDMRTVRRSLRPYTGATS